VKLKLCMNKTRQDKYYPLLICFQKTLYSFHQYHGGGLVPMESEVLRATAIVFLIRTNLVLIMRYTNIFLAAIPIPDILLYFLGDNNPMTIETTERAAFESSPFHVGCGYPRHRHRDRRPDFWGRTWGRCRKSRSR